MINKQTWPNLLLFVGHNHVFHVLERLFRVRNLLVLANEVANARKLFLVLPQQKQKIFDLENRFVLFMSNPQNKDQRKP